MKTWSRKITTVVLSGSLFITSSATASGGRGVYEVTVTNVTQGEIFTPIMVASHPRGLRLFEFGEAAGNELATRADAAKGHLELEEIAVSEIVDQITALYAPQVIEKRISLVRDLDDDVQRVSADPDKLLQILSNLVQNACQYTPEDGRVQISAERVDKQIRISVENSGAPIPEQDLSRLFERFYRPDKSRSRDSGGAGIGLAIVKQLVEAHRGEVGLENSANGVRVWFTLPVRIPATESELL
jgi:signal transduction histidine kinase